MPEAARRFESDLRAIREARNVSLADVNRETRIPIDVIERLEAGRLVGDSAFNEIYLKNLLRSYAESLGLANTPVLDAFEAQKAGRYRGELRSFLGEEAAAPREPAPAPEPEPEPPAETLPPRAASTAPAVHALEHTREKAAPPPPPPKTAAPQRVRPEGGPAMPLDRSWGLIALGTIAGIVVIGGLLWFLLRTDEPEAIERPRAAQATEAPEEEAGADTVAAGPMAPPTGSPAPQLQSPIRVTVIAQDGPLQNFRVTAAPDVRRPYWMEQGQSETFESETEVVVWGVESGGGFAIPQNARVQLQGYTWQPAGTVLRINRERGQALLDSLHRVQGVPQGGAPAQPAPQPAPAQPAPGQG